MFNTSLVYIEKDNKYLLLHRIKKENDVNKDKWIGVGGKFLENESPEECAKRETKEETGLDLLSLSYRGIVTFIAKGFEGEYMHLFHSDSFQGKIKDCDEGVLEWIDKNEMLSLPIWEGDKIFLKLINDNSPFFALKLEYDGDSLIRATLDGEELAI